MTIHIDKSEVLALMRKQPWKAMQDYADIIEKNDKTNESYPEAQREYRNYYSQLRKDKINTINRDKRDFFMTYLYPSVKNFLNTFGITVDYMGWDSQTTKMVLMKGDTRHPLKFVNNGVGMSKIAAHIKSILPSIKNNEIKEDSFVSNKLRAGIQALQNAPEGDYKVTITDKNQKE